ncbi:MAG: biopolymer transporter ExbD [Stenotrophomonas maltophilia]
MEVRVDAENQAYWNGQPIAVETLALRLQEQAHDHAGNLPTLRIAADSDAHYDVMVKVLAAVNSAGMDWIAFVQ